MDDANQPLDHYYNAFNVIHCRSCDGGIVDMHNFLYELARILRSDGVLLLIGGDTVGCESPFWIDTKDDLVASVG